MKLYPFTEIVSDVTSKFSKVKASEYNPEGSYKIIDQGKEPVAGYTDRADLVNFELRPIIVFGDHTRIFKYVESPIALGADGAKALRVNPKMADSLYVYYYLRSINIKAAGYSRHFKFLKETKIPIPFKDGQPNLNDQIHIAHLLGKVEGLIAQRKENLQQLDELLKSVFLEMFGDPITNPKSFPVRKLSEFYINHKDGTKCGPFGSALKKEEMVDTGVPVWNMDNIDLSSRIILPFRMWITAEKYRQLTSYSVVDGDIIISRAGTVGKMCVAKMNGKLGIISTNLIRLRLGSELLPLYFVSLMTHCKGRVGRLKTGPDGTFTHMNTGILDKLEFPYPPIALQKQFAVIVEKFEGIKSHYQHSLIELENLYAVLSQKAFKGELDLSRVVIVAKQEKESVEAAELEIHTATDTFVEPAIELPTPAVVSDLLNSERRLNVIELWFDSYFKQRSGMAISAQEFLGKAQQKLWELQEDDTYQLSVAEYDHVKELIFKAIESGRLTQTYYNVTNSLLISDALG